MTLAFLKHLLPSILFIFTLSACVMPGGGTPVKFDSINSQEVVLSPYYLGNPAQGGDHAWYMKLKISDRVPVAGFLKPNQMLTESLTRAIFALKPASGKVLLSSAGIPTKGCEGLYSAQISIQPEGGIKGSLSFSNYSDDCSMVLNGQVPFAGEMDMASGETEIELQLPPLAARLAEKKLQLTGSLELTFNAFKGEKQLVLNRSTMIMADETGPRIRLSPVTFSWDRRGKFLDEALDGQFVVEPYGVVHLETTSPLQIRHDGKNPIKGALRFHGDNGSWIRLYFAKEGLPGFFRLDGDDGFETIGQL